MPDNRSKLREKIKEALTSVLPVTAIVLLLCFISLSDSKQLTACFYTWRCVADCRNCIVYIRGRYCYGADRKQGRL